MGLYEYVVGLLTIVSGLALTEIALRFSRLIEFRRTVRWDLQPFLCVLVGISTLIVNWSISWKPDNNLPHYTVGAFVIALLNTLLLYLAIATALPSEIDRDTDLSDFYASQNKAFWSLFTATLMLFIARIFWKGELVPSWVWLVAALELALSISPIIWRNRVFHCFACVALTLITLGPALMQEF